MRRQPIPLLICESGNRWRDAARRFLGANPHRRDRRDLPREHFEDRDSADEGPDAIGSEFGTRFEVLSVEHSKVRALIAGFQDLVLLWECTPDQAQSIALTVAQVGAARPDALQLASVSAPSRNQRLDLSLQMQAIGIAAVLETPEQLENLSRLIRRKFA